MLLECSSVAIAGQKRNSAGTDHVHDCVCTGVDDITAVVIILLEGNPKDKSWGAAQKLMNNVDKFMERLRGFKAVIDQGQVRNDLPNTHLSQPWRLTTCYTLSRAALEP